MKAKLWFLENKKFFSMRLIQVENVPVRLYKSQLFAPNRLYFRRNSHAKISTKSWKYL